MALTPAEWVALTAMRAVLREHDLTAAELVLIVKADLAASGMVSESVIRKVDDAWIGRGLLAGWHREKPPLVEAEFREEDRDARGRPSRGAHRAYALTSARLDALRSPERKGGLLE